LPIPTAAAAAGEVAATIEMAREEDGSLWIYLIDGDNEKCPIREITWAFEKEEGLECWIGAYSARPNNDTGKDLVVGFEGLEIETV
jgi:hypothetical protein